VGLSLASVEMTFLFVGVEDFAVEMTFVRGRRTLRSR
jgi:hypothetical protein